MLAEKEILSKIPAIQNYPCPVVPSVFKFYNTFFSLLFNTVHKETVEELKELIVDSKKDLQEANLQRANLVDANLQRANLHEANLERAHLQRANLHKAYLVEADLKGANLLEANLVEANLGGANLQGACLVNANLQGAYFQSTLERGLFWVAEANLHGTKLHGAYLVEADLKGVCNLTIEQLSKVKTLYKAKLDPELMEQVKEKFPHLLERPDNYEGPEDDKNQRKD
jgi:hypothetical protein